MRMLLDTHALLWWSARSSALSDAARQAISDPSNEVFLSVVSAWEIQIKAQLGKLHLQRPLGAIVAEQQAQNGFRLLPVELDHVNALDRLPLHHRDPFDRLLLAQALEGGLHLVSHDARFGAYPVPILW